MPVQPALRVLYSGRTRALPSWLQVAPGRLAVEGPVEPAALSVEVHRRRPAIVILSVRPPVAELQASVGSLMAASPVPILLVADGAQRQAALHLLRLGALDVMPEADDPATLVRTLRLLSTVRVLTHPRPAGRRLRAPAVRGPFPVVAIAASLGGPVALATLLAGLDPELPSGIVICQHLGDGFHRELARWLAREVGRPVRTAVDGQPLGPGQLVVAGAGGHLTVSASGHLQVEPSAPVGGFRPSADVLFSSVARNFGALAAGVVLTGMGEDGARGLLAIRQRGGHTVAQDEATSTVFGMPAAAIALGAAERVVPLPGIPSQLMSWMSSLQHR